MVPVPGSPGTQAFYKAVYQAYLNGHDDNFDRLFAMVVKDPNLRHLERAVQEAASALSRLKHQMQMVKNGANTPD